MDNPRTVPLATVMVPTYGQAEQLPRAIRSALDQDLESLEVLVIDDASPDDTSSVVGRISDDRLRYHRNPRNVGRVANYRNALYTLARGKYVLNLDGDDWLVDKTYIRRATELLEKHQEMVLVFANAMRYMEATSEFLIRTDQNEALPKINSGSDLFLRYPGNEVWIPHLTAVYRRSDALQIGFYDTDVLGSDTESILRLIIDRQVGFLATTAAAWRVHGHNASGSVDVSERIANLVCADSPYEFAKSKGSFGGHALERWRLLMLRRLCLDFLRQSVRSSGVASALRFMGALTLSRPLTAFDVALASTKMIAGRFFKVGEPAGKFQRAYTLTELETTEGEL